jgi:hypothetical protein
MKNLGESFEQMLINTIMVNCQAALKIVGEWAELNVSATPDIERDREVVDAIKFIDKSADVLLNLGVSAKDINKLLSSYLFKKLKV